MLKRTKKGRKSVAKAPFSSWVVAPDNSAVHVSVTHTITREDMDLVLDFLYIATLDDWSDTARLLYLADVFKLPNMKTMAENANSNQDFADTLNESLRTWLLDERGAKCKSLFLNKELFSDATISLRDDDTERNIPIHRAILMCRSDVFNRMLCGSFAESSGIIRIGEAHYEPLMGVLEYCYCDHSPLENNPLAANILMLAHEYNIERLITLAELYVSFTVNAAVAESIRKAHDFPLIELLLLSKQYDAKQLHAMLRFFCASNYNSILQRRDYELLKDEGEDDLEWIEENQWPPKSYLQQMEEWEKRNKKSAKKEKEGGFARFLFSH